jgi:hypothetical protein
MGEMNYENWEQIKTKLKRLFPQLTEADFKKRNEEEDSILRMIEHKLQKSRSDLRKIINDL